MGRIAVLSTILSGILSSSLTSLAWKFSTSSGILSDPILFWHLYVISLTSFHLLEFFITLLRNPTDASSTSFLVDHSVSYTAAALASVIEFWVRYNLFQDWCLPKLSMCFGCLMTFTGLIIRETAIWQCGSNFNHMIRTQKTANHKLITTGIYSKFRHPSYFGWFYWSIGSQLMLGNWVCFVGYWWAGWKFFKARIPFEEGKLVGEYGDEYVSYSRKTIIGIPLVTTKTHKIELKKKE